MRHCADCKRPIDLDAFPNFVKVENARRCRECSAIALWQLIAPGTSFCDFDALEKLVALDDLDDLDKLAEEAAE